MRTSMVLAPRCSANQSKGYPGALRKRPWEQVRSRTAVAWARDNVLEAFLCHLGDFRRHFGTQLGANGLPKSSFLAPSLPKVSQNDVQGRVLEKVWIVDGIWSGKYEFLNVLDPPKCFVYKHFGGFSRLRQILLIALKIMPKWCPICYRIKFAGTFGFKFWDSWRFWEVFSKMCVFRCRFLVSKSRSGKLRAAPAGSDRLRPVPAGPPGWKTVIGEVHREGGKRGRVSNRKIMK